MLNPDNETLEWCAKWIEDSLRAETNERTIEFGKNVAMTIRAVKTKIAAATPLTATAAKSLLRDPVKVDVSKPSAPPPLIVTRDGVPCADQAAALEEFKERCRASNDKVAGCVHGIPICRDCQKSAATSGAREAAAKEIDQWTRRAYPFGCGMTEEARLSKLTAIISRHFPSAVPVEEQKLTDLQRAIVEHDDDMARLDRNTLRENKNEHN